MGKRLFTKPFRFTCKSTELFWQLPGQKCANSLPKALIQSFQVLEIVARIRTDHNS